MGEQDHRAAGGQASRHIADAEEMDTAAVSCVLEAKAVAAEEAAAAKKPRLDSPAPSTLRMARQDTGHRGAPAAAVSGFVGGSPAVVFDP